MQKVCRCLEAFFCLIPKENETHLETTKVLLQHNGQSSSQRWAIFPGQEKIPEGGRDQTDVFGLGQSLINREIYSIRTVILPERNGGSFKLTIHRLQQKAGECKSSRDCRGRNKQKPTEFKWSSAIMRRDNREQWQILRSKLSLSRAEA